MVSDSELVGRLREILRDSDLETTTAGGLRRRLEEEFSVDLSGRKVFVREQIDLFLQEEATNNSGAEQEQEVDEDAQNDAVEEDQGERGNLAEDANENENENAQEEDVSDQEKDEEEEEEEEEVRDVKRRKRNKSVDTDVVKKKGGGGFTKPCALSPQLEEFLGESVLARTEVVKKIWAYIREHNLQNPKNRRKILCDEALHGIFRVKSIDMFQMNKVLSKHIWPLDELQSTQVESPERETECKKDSEEDSDDEPKRKEKEKPRKGASGFTAPLPLSDALVQFFDTGERELSRAEVVKKMWQYIKENELQDPSDKRMILCDDKLKELFGVDSFHGFTVSKLLTSHFIKNQR